MNLTEALVVCEKELPWIRQSLEEQVSDDITAIEKPALTEDQLFDELMEKVYLLRVKKVSEYRVKVMNRITSYLETRNRPMNRNRVSQEDIERAREFPLTELYDGRLRHGFGICPFHNERTASFHIKDNRFRCYGCDEWGDSIAFVMKRDNCGFLEAVRKLI